MDLHGRMQPDGGTDPAGNPREARVPRTSVDVFVEEGNAFFVEDDVDERADGRCR
jgi:hypothetical protein